MGIKERKIRERENRQRLILANAHELLIQEGLEGLTMRSIANRIEYSQSIIYEFFDGKDQLCQALCQELCEKLLGLLHAVKKEKAEKYLLDLVSTTIEFHTAHPHSDSLFTFVCFGPKRLEIPKAFLEVEQIFMNALKGLKSPYLSSEEEVMSALDIIRCIFIGVNTLIHTKTSLEGKSRALNISKNALQVLIRGWKK